MIPERPSAEELVVVVGPTASGKSDLAVALASAWDGEIVNADSVQIYRRFDAGSGKPSDAQRQRIPHHLLDAVDPLAPLDAAEFAHLADGAITEIRGRGRVPIVCGGTFLWIRALGWGLAQAPKGDPLIRQRHQQLAATEGRGKLHEELCKVDPALGAKLAPNDFVRVSRALEVWELSGRPLSAFQAEHRFATPRYRVQLYGVQRDERDLTARIEARTQQFLESGWINEVRNLLDEGLGDARAMGSVGYRQVREHVQGLIGPDDLGASIVRATRVFARRQRTWLRDQPVAWVS